ncbi:patatin-like phospholipase family protein [soil metagenome]
MKRLDLDRSDIASYLADIALFEGLSADALERLERSVDAVHVSGGEVVMEQGGPPDCLYLVHAGRLRATVVDGGVGRHLGSIGRGEVAGEMALISDEPRSATVVAERDSQLLRLGTDGFDQLIADDPQALRAVARQVVARMRRSMHAGEASSAPVTVALVARDQSGAVAETVRDLTEALSLLAGSAAVATGEGALTAAGDARGDAATSVLTKWTSEMERSRPLVIYLADPDPNTWTEMCLRQSDVVVVVADADRGPGAVSLDAAVDRRRATAGTRVELVLTHSGNGEPRGTAEWLRRRPVARHHHFRHGNGGDASRVARLLLHQGVTLVLSGGGARGMAEIGVLKAIEELGIPIDAVGGTSAGAVIGGCIARGWDFKLVRDTLRASVADGRPPVDPTFPAMSLTAGRRVTERLRKEIGEVDIEDFWRNFFCISTNLSQRRTQVHQLGPGWKAIRASFAIPGVFPPVPDGDDVLIDGGVLDNLPVGEMRRQHLGSTVVSVDVRTLRDIRAGTLSDSGIVSGWNLLWDRTRARRNPTGSLSIARLLTALTVLGGAKAGDDDDGDVVVRPAVQGFQILDFKRFDELVDRGYQAGMETLGTWLEGRTAGF